MPKVRLDALILKLGLVPSLEKARAHILAGEIWLGQQRLDKPGNLLDANSTVELRSEKSPFVSRGGEKLNHALKRFSVLVEERTCLDVGASTGGFTDCLLQKGAAKVLAIDVGKGQLDVHLRNNKRVTVLDETNARHLTLATLSAVFPEIANASLVVMDVAFIPLTKVIEPLSRECGHIKDWILLFKPQFEVAKKFVGKGGLVRSQEAVSEALKNFDSFMTASGFTHAGGPEISPVVGKKSGNVEYLLYYVLEISP